MKIRKPLYEGDGILRSGPQNCDVELSNPDPAADFLRRIILVRGVTYTIDALETEAKAQALRAKTLVAYAARFWNWLGERIEKARQGREETYLGEAQNGSDLEQRLRKLEREAQPTYV